MNRLLLTLGFVLFVNIAVSQIPPRKESEHGTGHLVPLFKGTPGSTPDGAKNAGTYIDKGKSGFVLQGNRQEAIYEDIQPTREGYMVKKDGLWGIVDKKGNLLGKIDYESVAASSTHTFKGFIVKKNKYGLIDEKGNPLTKMEFDEIEHLVDYFSPSSFIVKKNSKYGVLDLSGQPILSTKYNKILFSNSQSPVSFVFDQNNALRMVFSQGERMYPTVFEYAEVLGNMVIVKANGKFGVIKLNPANKEQVIIPFEYDNIFHSARNNTNTQKTKEQLLVKSSTQAIASHLIVQKDGKYGLINENGTIIYPPEMVSIRLDGSLPYQQYHISNGKQMGAYFPTTDKKMDIIYDYVQPRGQGFVEVHKDGLKGIFNHNAEQVIPIKYQEISTRWGEDTYYVTKAGKKGILNKAGYILIPIVYEEVTPLHESGFEGYLFVKSDKKTGVINRKNKTVIPILFDDIYIFKGLFYAIDYTPTRKVGLYNKSGEVIIPMEYQWIANSVTANSNVTILKKQDGTFSFMDKNFRLILTDVISEYGYIHDTDNLLKNPGENQHRLLYVKNSKGRIGLVDETNEKLAVPIVYDTIQQKLETPKQTYLSVRKNRKYGLIDQNNNTIIPFDYDAMNLDLAKQMLLRLTTRSISDITSRTPNTEEDTRNYVEDNDNLTVVVSKRKKFGVVNFKNEVKVPFIYDDVQRVSETGIFKAKKGKYYQIINENNEVLNPGPFDDVANFERLQTDYRYNQTPRHYEQALTFLNGKMRIINEKGAFLTEEVAMDMHQGYKSFNELKTALVRALDSKEDDLLKEFAGKIAPSAHPIHLIKETELNRNGLEYMNIEDIQERYFNELLAFKRYYWDSDKASQLRQAIVDVTGFANYEKGFLMTNRYEYHNFGDERPIGDMLKNSVKINGFWISAYFLHGRFQNPRW